MASRKGGGGGYVDDYDDGYDNDDWDVDGDEGYDAYDRSGGGAVLSGGGGGKKAKVKRRRKQSVVRPVGRPGGVVRGGERTGYRP